MMRLFALLLAAAIFTADAANFSVTTPANSGAGSLRQAILDANAAANPPHTIAFLPDFPFSAAITLQSALPVIQVSTNLRGNGRSPILDGVDTYAILRVGSGISVDIDQLNFRYGRRSKGGCIALNGVGTSASLFVSRSGFYRCQARDTFTPGGGAIAWPTNGGGLLVVSESYFTENAAISTDIANEQPRGGAIESYSVTVLTDNVFESNTVQAAGSNGGFGGAVYLAVPSGIFESEMSGNRFRFNSVTPTASVFGRGGAVHAHIADGGLLALQRNWFRGNAGREGGAASISANNGDVAQLTLRNNGFYNHSVTASGGALALNNMRLAAEHNSFYNNDAPVAAHLQMTGGAALRFVNNVMARTFSGSACGYASVNFTALYRAGNHFKHTCVGWSDAGGAINSAMSEPAVDESQRVGVLVFDGDDGPIDGGSATPEDCLPDDARYNERPADGDADGQLECDAGAYEHPEALLFRNGFE